MTSGICSISDVHVRNPEDERYFWLLKFLDSSEVKSSQMIILLGDIFDLMVGNHQEYIELYKDFFIKLKKLNHEGKIISYFEGNHDLHLSNLFRKKFPFIQVRTGPVIEEFHGKRLHFSHGDDFDLQNLAYQRYKKILNSRFCQRLANGIVSYDFIKKIGEYSSKKSRKRNYSIDKEKLNNLKINYRKNILKSVDGLIDIVVFGHSHFTEEDIVKIKDKSVYLLNNGFFPSSKSFVYITEQSQSLVPLNV